MHGRLLGPQRSISEVRFESPLRFAFFPFVSSLVEH